MHIGLQDLKVVAAVALPGPNVKALLLFSMLSVAAFWKVTSLRMVCLIFNGSSLSERLFHLELDENKLRTVYCTLYVRQQQPSIE